MLFCAYCRLCSSRIETASLNQPETRQGFLGDNKSSVLNAAGADLNPLCIKRPLRFSCSLVRGGHSAKVWGDLSGREDFARGWV